MCELLQVLTKGGAVSTPLHAMLDGPFLQQ